MKTDLTIGANTKKYQQFQNIDNFNRLVLELMKSDKSDIENRARIENDLFTMCDILSPADIGLFLQYVVDMYKRCFIKLCLTYSYPSDKKGEYSVTPNSLKELSKYMKHRVVYGEKYHQLLEMFNTYSSMGMWHKLDRIKICKILVNCKF